MDDKKQIVLVADSFDYNGNKLKVYDRKIDRPNSSYVKELIKAIEVNYVCIWYSNLQDFIDNISIHKNDIIFPYWFGESSRNRHSLVPAICEAANIKYVGGDAYTKIVCNDKKLSQELCRQAELNFPDSIVINSKEDLPIIDTLNYPCVVKPMFEGTSLGISQKNLVKDIETTKKLSLELLKEFKSPVIIEEFVIGREVSICLIGRKDYLKLWSAGERYMLDNEKYFYDKLYSFEEKKQDDFNLSFKSINNEIEQDVLSACQRLFYMLDKVEYMRIDGKLYNGKFTVIELTPETHLGENAEFCAGFVKSGHKYSEIISILIENCQERYQNQNANEIYRQDKIQD